MTKFIIGITTQSSHVFFTVLKDTGEIPYHHLCRRRLFHVSIIFSRALPLDFLKKLKERFSYLDIFHHNKILALGTSTGMIQGHCCMLPHYTVTIDTRQHLKRESDIALVNFKTSQQLCLASLFLFPGPSHFILNAATTQMVKSTLRYFCKTRKCGVRKWGQISINLHRAISSC